MKLIVRRASALLTALVVTLPLAYAPAGAGTESGPGRGSGPDSVTVFIGNRMFPDFGEIVSTRLRERQQIGDTEFSFEVVSFYPDFAIMDSTRSIVSVSDEPKNPAFRIMVFKEDAAVDSTWAFYNLNIPHFSRNSPIWFRALAFDYRGEVFRKEAPKEPEQERKEKK